MENKMLADVIEYVGGKITVAGTYSTKYVDSEVDVTNATMFDIDTEVEYGGGCETCAYEWSETKISFYDDNGFMGKATFDYTEFLRWLYENKVVKS